MVVRFFFFFFYVFFAAFGVANEHGNQVSIVSRSWTIHPFPKAILASETGEDRRQTRYWTSLELDNDTQKEKWKTKSPSPTR